MGAKGFGLASPLSFPAAPDGAKGLGLAGSALACAPESLVAAPNKSKPFFGPPAGAPTPKWSMAKGVVPGRKCASRGLTGKAPCGRSVSESDSVDKSAHYKPRRNTHCTRPSSSIPDSTTKPPWILAVGLRGASSPIQVSSWAGAACSGTPASAGGTGSNGTGSGENSS